MANPYKQKLQFHYAPLHVQLVSYLEDAGLFKIIDTDKHFVFHDAMVRHSMGMAFGLSDEAVYVLAFGILAFAIFKFLGV